MIHQILLTIFCNFLILKFVKPTENSTLIGPLRFLSQRQDIRLKYCKKNAFMKTFVFPNRILPKDMSKFMDTHCEEECRSIAYPYFTQSLTRDGFTTGVFGMKKSDNCWIYYLEGRSKKRQKILLYRYLTPKDTKDGVFNLYWNETADNFGDTLTFRLVRIPGGNEQSIKRGYYKDGCHKIAYGFTTRFYWSQIGLQRDCNRYYDEWNIFTVSYKVCQTFTNQHNNKDIHPLAISKYINSTLSFDKCTIYFRQLAVPIQPSEFRFKYVWLTLSVVPIFFVSIFLIFTCHFRKRRSRKTNKSNNGLENINKRTGEKEKPSEGGKVVLPDRISVMILHRPGCEILDNFVRDLSFIIHSYNIHVTSPLLEMSNIDAEGGIASYIQRNIDTCTYVIVVITPSSNGNTAIEHLHRPFEFSMRILSGLAFRQNESSRYIPVYIGNYKEIISEIPPFLCASNMCGYEVPDKLKDLISYMTQEETAKLQKEQKERREFFVRKLKSNAKLMTNAVPHKHCYNSHCSQGVLKDDDASCGWTGTSSSCAYQIIPGNHLSSKSTNYLEQKTDKRSSKDTTYEHIECIFSDRHVPSGNLKFDSITNTASQVLKHNKQLDDLFAGSNFVLDTNSRNDSFTQTLEHSQQSETCSVRNSPLDNLLNEHFTQPKHFKVQSNENIDTDFGFTLNPGKGTIDLDLTTQKILAWKSHLMSVSSSETENMTRDIIDHRDYYLYLQS